MRRPPQDPSAVWLFDVDGCLIDSLTGKSLRPGATELLDALQTSGVTVWLWSAGGADYAKQRAVEADIGHLVDGFHDKDGRDADGRYRTTHIVGHTNGVVFIDDRPEDMPIGADVIAVSPYLAHNPHDRGLDLARSRARSRSRVNGTNAPTR
jgi:hypothetical protein